MERVFEEREMLERYNLSQMILHYFKPCSPQKSQISGMNATELYHLYLVHNPHSKLTSGIVHNLLLMGGYVQRETGAEMELFAEIREEAFIDADKTIQMSLLKHITGPMEVKYRQIALGIKIRKVQEDGTYTFVDNPINSVTIFIQRWTINRNDRYHFYMKPANRSTVLEVFNFYRFVCVSYGMDIVSKRMFYEAVENMGYSISTGAVHGKAGNRYFKGLFIPQDTNDIKLSLDINAAVIFNGRTHWTKNNELLENYTEALREALKEDNLRRMKVYEGEQTKAQASRPTEKMDDRRTIENIQTPINITEATPEEKYEVEKLMEEAITDKTDDTQNKDAIEEEPENTYLQVLYADSTPIIYREADPIEDDIAEIENAENSDGSAETGQVEASSDSSSRKLNDESSLSDIIKSKPSKHIVKNSAAKRVLAEFDGTGPKTITESFDEPEQGPEASFEEIAEAMKIPYKMDPKNFTVDVFADWLDKMDLHCPDVKAYYEHVMRIINE